MRTAAACARRRHAHGGSMRTAAACACASRHHHAHGGGRVDGQDGLVDRHDDASPARAVRLDLGRRPAAKGAGGGAGGARKGHLGRGSRTPIAEWFRKNGSIVRARPQVASRWRDPFPALPAAGFPSRMATQALTLCMSFRLRPVSSPDVGSWAPTTLHQLQDRAPWHSIIKWIHTKK